MAELEALAEEQIVLEWNEISITLTVTLDGGKVRGWGLLWSGGLLAWADVPLFAVANPRTL